MFTSSVVVIDRVEYEVYYRYAKQYVRMRYSPNMEETYVMDPYGELSPILLLNKTDNAAQKRERIRLSEGVSIMMNYTARHGLEFNPFS